MMILSLGENDTILLQSVDAQRHDSYRVSLMIARTKWFSPLTHKTQIKKKKKRFKTTTDHPGTLRTHLALQPGAYFVWEKPPHERLSARTHPRHQISSL